MSGPESNWEAWVAKAEGDLLNIENNMASREVPWDTVCFHAQQAAEKYLKALLVSRGRIPPKTHDLVALLTECMDLEPGLEVIEEECHALTAHAIGTRYPADLYEPDEAEARRMHEAARRVRVAVRQRLAVK
ncbi:MAG: HEPN domain-containing protein [Planctomycetota bacterium]|nr:HEPN domain-containing protein [Planctomycetota bacterium]